MRTLLILAVAFVLGWLASREHRRWRARRFMAAGVKTAHLPLGKLTQEEWEGLVDELAASRKRALERD